MRQDNNKIILSLPEARELLAKLKKSSIKDALYEIVPPKKTKTDYTIARIESLGYTVSMYAPKKYRAVKGEIILMGSISGIFKKLFYTKKTN